MDADAIYRQIGTVGADITAALDTFYSNRPASIQHLLDAVGTLTQAIETLEGDD